MHWFNTYFKSYRVYRVLKQVKDWNSQIQGVVKELLMFNFESPNSEIQ